MTLVLVQICDVTACAENCDASAENFQHFFFELGPALINVFIMKIIITISRVYVRNYEIKLTKNGCC